MHFVWSIYIVFQAGLTPKYFIRVSNMNFINVSCVLFINMLRIVIDILFIDMSG